MTLLHLLMIKQTWLTGSNKNMVKITDKRSRLHPARVSSGSNAAEAGQS